MADPFEEYENYKQQYDQITATGPVLSEADQALADANLRTEKEAYQRYRQIGPRRRVMAGARNIVNSMPIVRHIPGIREFANPEAGSEAQRDVYDYKTGMPTHSRVGGFLGNTTPYALSAAAAPGLFSTLPGAMIGNAAIGGTEAHLSGENPVLAGAFSAAGTLPFWAAGRVLTPRSNAVASHAHAVRDLTRREGMATINDDLSDALVNALSGIGGRRTNGQFARRYTPEQASRIAERGRARANEEIDNLFRPAPQIPQIPEGNTTREMLTWGAIGTALGHMTGTNPWGGIGGVLAPYVRRRAIDTTNRAINRLNDSLSQSEIGRALGQAGFAYANNRVLPDRVRSIAHAIGGPTGDETLRRKRIPRLRE